MSPKIQEATIREQRQMRQRQLMDAALSLAMEDGVGSVTVSAVAKRAGLARSSIYEYFASSADLIADLVMEEMAYYNQRLLKAVDNVASVRIESGYDAAQEIMYAQKYAIAGLRALAL